MPKFRKKPVVVEARQWTGGDYEWLNQFCGWNWGRADVQGMSFDDPEQVVVFNTAEQQWLHLPVRHWLIRGIHGELYPCEDQIFKATYEPVSESPDAAMSEEAPDAPTA